MSRLIPLAYVAALFTWLPLLWPALRYRSIAPGRILWFAIAASLLAMLYEGYITFVWSRTVVAPIRVDILVIIMPLLCLVYGATALRLFMTAGRLPAGSHGKSALIVTALLCSAIPVTAGLGWIDLDRSSRQLAVDFDAGRRYRFEAMFRDDATRRRFFGNLQSDTNPWAGYYACDDPRGWFQHLVINAAGDIWLYRSNLDALEGRQDADNGTADNLTARLQGGGGGGYRISVTRQGGMDVSLAVDIDNPRETGNRQAYGHPLRFAKRQPPVFPLPASAADEVRFLGVFSGRTEGGSGFWVTQLWLWESDAQVWGRYLRNHFRPGSTARFLGARSVEIHCNGPCTNLDLSFDTDRGAARIMRHDGDALQADLYGVREPVVLQRGAIVPGFLLDLAPLSTRQENLDWLRAVSAGQFVEWTPPE